MKNSLDHGSPEPTSQDRGFFYQHRNKIGCAGMIAFIGAMGFAINEGIKADERREEKREAALSLLQSQYGDRVRNLVESTGIPPENFMEASFTVSCPPRGNFSRLVTPTGELAYAHELPPCTTDSNSRELINWILGDRHTNTSPHGNIYQNDSIEGEIFQEWLNSLPFEDYTAPNGRTGRRKEAIMRDFVDYLSSLPTEALSEKTAPPNEASGNASN